jgi:hypothetical protein
MDFVLGNGRQKSVGRYLQLFDTVILMFPAKKSRAGMRPLSLRQKIWILLFLPSRVVKRDTKNTIPTRTLYGCLSFHRHPFYESVDSSNPLPP